MTADNKRTQGCMNALKQKENGGYGEKAEETGERVLNIRLNGMSWEAFK